MGGRQTWVRKMLDAANLGRVATYSLREERAQKRRLERTRRPGSLTRAPRPTAAPLHPRARRTPCPPGNREPSGGGLRSAAAGPDRVATESRAPSGPLRPDAPTRRGGPRAAWERPRGRGGGAAAAGWWAQGRGAGPSPSGSRAPLGRAPGCPQPSRGPAHSCARAARGRPGGERCGWLPDAEPLIGP